MKEKRTKSKRLLHPREESSWRNMLSRCYNQNSTGYTLYGGRGITVCPEWRINFYKFLEDMGERPENTSLDRINYNKNYNKENCRWASYKDQANNTSGNVLISFKGEIKTISQWAEHLGIKTNTLQYRLYRGWSVEKALKTKLEKEITNATRSTSPKRRRKPKDDNGS